MAKRIFIDCSVGNVIAALAEESKLLEFHIERKGQTNFVGNIYKGKVVNVLSGMQAAFVNLGIGKNGYLSLGDMLMDRSELPGATIPEKLNIASGDDILVQIVKDSVGTKGVRCSPFLSFAGFYLVYMPLFNIIGVSRKITDQSRRDKLVSIVESFKLPGGFIVRTNGESVSKKEMKKEAEYLVSLYRETVKNGETCDSPNIVYEEGDLPMRMLRDVYSEDIKEIIVGDDEIYNRLVALGNKRKDQFRQKLIRFDKTRDMFRSFGLGPDVDSLLRNRVELSSGAYIVIDHTEALTVVDVNTGKYTGGCNLEDTVFSTNMLATVEIARQVRLRNIGGIVIVDFIDMETEEHRNAVVETLTDALKQDRAKCNVVAMSSLGLVEFTRKKKRKESSAMLEQVCPYCHGSGSIFSKDYVALKIRASLLDVFSEGFLAAIVEMNAEVADYILKMNILSNDVRKIWVDKRIYLIPHRTFHAEYFVVRGDNSKVLELPDKAVLLF